MPVSMDLVFYVFLFSIFVNYLVILFSRRYRFGIDYFNESNHKVHFLNVPRIGGLGIFISFILFFIFLDKNNLTSNIVFYGSLIFIIGIIEDFYRNIPAIFRLSLIALIVSVSVISIGEEAIVKNVDFFSMSYIMGFLFTVFAVTGVINAFNISDGINGLSSGIAIISSIYMIFVCFGNDFMMCNMLLVFVSGVVGFFVINFFTGKIFLGDGGAYFIGYIISMTSVIMSNRFSSTVSPWFFLVVLSYPVFETLFSIYRRSFVRGVKPFHPDRLHMHTLLYKRVFKNQFKTSFFILNVIFIQSYVGYMFKNKSVLLLFIFLFFCMIYVYFYWYIIRTTFYVEKKR